MSDKPGKSNNEFINFLKVIRDGITTHYLGILLGIVTGTSTLSALNSYQSIDEYEKIKAHTQTLSASASQIQTNAEILSNTVSQVSIASSKLASLDSQLDLIRTNLVALEAKVDSYSMNFMASHSSLKADDNEQINKMRDLETSLRENKLSFNKIESQMKIISRYTELLHTNNTKLLNMTNKLSNMQQEFMALN